MNGLLRKRWVSVVLALALALCILAVSVYLSRATLYGWRAAWLRESAVKAEQSGDLETALNKARSAWLVAPGNTESARLLFDLTADIVPNEAYQWLLFLEQNEALDLARIDKAATLSMRLNQPAMAQFWRSELSKTLPAGDPLLVEVDGLLSGLWGPSEAWLEWILQEPLPRLEGTADRGVLQLITLRLGAVQRQTLLETIEALASELERDTLLELGQGFSSHRELSVEEWARIWGILREDMRLSGTEQLGCLLSAVEIGKLPTDRLRADLLELDLFATESAGLLSLLRFRLGDFEEAAALADDPLTALGEPWRTQIRVRSRFEVGPEKAFFETVETTTGLNSAARLAWLGRGTLRFKEDPTAAKILFDEAAETAQGNEISELATLYQQWGLIDEARALHHDLLEHPGFSQQAVAFLTRDAFASGSEETLVKALSQAQFTATEANSVIPQLCYAAWLFSDRLGEARDWLTRLAMDQPADEDLRLLLAAVHLRLGEPGIARLFWRGRGKVEVPPTESERVQLLRAWVGEAFGETVSEAQANRLRAGWTDAFPAEQALVQALSLPPAP